MVACDSGAWAAGQHGLQRGRRCAAACNTATIGHETIPATLQARMQHAAAILLPSCSNAACAACDMHRTASLHDARCMQHATNNIQRENRRCFRAGGQWQYRSHAVHIVRSREAPNCVHPMLAWSITSAYVASLHYCMLHPRIVACCVLHTPNLPKRVAHVWASPTGSCTMHRTTCSRQTMAIVQHATHSMQHAQVWSCC